MKKKTLNISNNKAPQFRMYAAEGALGGITPAQQFQINFYLESPNFPKEITHHLNEDGTLGAQLGQNMEGGDIVRELQCGVVLSIPQAESLAKWILKTLETKKAAVSHVNDNIVM